MTVANGRISISTSPLSVQDSGSALGQKCLLIKSLANVFGENDGSTDCVRIRRMSLRMVMSFSRPAVHASFTRSGGGVVGNAVFHRCLRSWSSGISQISSLFSVMIFSRRRVASTHASSPGYPMNFADAGGDSGDRGGCCSVCILTCYYTLIFLIGKLPDANGMSRRSLCESMLTPRGPVCVRRSALGERPSSVGILLR